MFGAVTHFLPNFLRDLLHYNPGDGVTNFLRDLYADLFGDFLLHIHRILGTNCFGEFLTLFSGNVDRKILTPFIGDLKRNDTYTFG